MALGLSQVVEDEELHAQFVARFMEVGQCRRTAVCRDWEVFQAWRGRQYALAGAEVSGHTSITV